MKRSLISMVLPDEQSICRICLGPEEDHIADRLFRPCLCRGTAQYVHVQCLNKWRATGGNHFYKCGTCHYNYRLARAQYALYLQNRYVLAACTLCVIVLAVLFVMTCMGIAGLLLGLKFAKGAQHTMAILGKLTMWSILCIGMVTMVLMLKEERGAMLWPDLGHMWHLDLWALYYGFSLCGFILFVCRVYSRIELEVNHYLIQLSDVVLEVT